MALYTDLIDPAELTGFARAALDDVELSNTFVKWLPNKLVPDTQVRFITTEAGGLVQEARFRAFEAEPERIKTSGGARKILELPAISVKETVTELDQLRNRRIGTDAAKLAAFNSTETLVKAVARRMERMRATVLLTGKATVTAAEQNNFYIDDDFGRDPALTTTAPVLFSDPASDPLGYIETLVDLYVDKNGVEPGVVVMSRRVFRAIQSNAKLASLLVNGASRPATAEDVNTYFSVYGLPDIQLLKNKNIPDDRIMLLPETGEGMGATFWGETVTGTLPNFGLAAADMPGLVAGIWENDNVPVTRELVVDAIGMPVLANPNLSLVAKVL